MIDLQRPRDAGELLTETFRTFGRRWHVFVAMTFVVVAPVIVLVDGVWGKVLAQGPEVDRPDAAAVASVLLAATVVPALVTGLHCIVVVALADGRAMGAGEAARALAPRVPRALAAVTRYALAVGLGFLALIVPGIWIAIRWYFAVQAAVLEGHGPRAATTRSAGLVDGGWWRVFGLWLLMSILSGLLVSPAASATYGGSGVAWIAAQVASQTVALSLSAIYGTLLFFDLCARHDAGPAAPWAVREARHEWLPPQPPPIP